MKPGGEIYDARAKVLSECVKHHLREGQRFSRIFTRAKSSGHDLNAMGKPLEARRREPVTKFGAHYPDCRTGRSMAEALAPA
jgi:hypothetical protein